MSLMSRVEDKITGEPNSGCWLWIGACSDVGYGKIWNGDRVMEATRYVYEQIRGAIPEGLELDHLCRTRCCVNPSHLEPVTHQENMRRGIAGALASSRYAAMTHCVNGHKRTPGNVYLGQTAKGHVRRKCRACENMRQQKRRRELHGR